MHHFYIFAYKEKLILKIRKKYKIYFDTVIYCKLLIVFLCKNELKKLYPLK